MYAFNNLYSSDIWPRKVGLAFTFSFVTSYMTEIYFYMVYEVGKNCLTV